MFLGVSCGIPDFRSRDGLYASLKARGDYDLDDPQQMYEHMLPYIPLAFDKDPRFDIDYFKENPSGMRFLFRTRISSQTCYSVLVSCAKTHYLLKPDPTRLQLLC